MKRFILRSRLGHVVAHQVLSVHENREYTLNLSTESRVRVDSKNRVFLIGGRLDYDVKRNRWTLGPYRENDFPKLLGTFLGCEETTRASVDLVS